MKRNQMIILVLMLQSIFSFSQWTQKTDFGGLNRFGAVCFTIGTKAYVGTGYNVPTPLIGTKDFWEYNPSTDTWLQKADFAGTARGYAIGFSIGTKGYIATGMDSAGLLKDLWEYDSGNDTWTQKADFLGTARYGAVGFSIGNKGYIGTGSDTTGNLNDFWEYNPSTDSWSQKANFGGSKRKNAIGFAIDNNGYIGTGLDSISELIDFWKYNSVNDSWSQMADLLGNTRQTAISFTIGQKGYVGAGKSASIYLDFCEYDPTTNSWTVKADFSEVKRAYAVGFSIGNKGYISTGITESIDDPPTIFRDLWEYDLSADNINESKRNSEINIFPNPTNDIITIESPLNSNIELISLTGQVLKSFNSNVTKQLINIANLENGVYIIKAKTDKGIAIMKFTKQ
jgi:N-acetylneuraminic acid mutarotase